ncbi:MAG: alpha/beta hydrolase [Candidatus Omnitrophota bacterium]
MLEPKSILINDVNIAYCEQGHGRPVLFVHGFASSSHTWLALMGLLPAGPRYIALDLKGFGHSGKPEDNHYSAYDQAEILTAFINALELEHPILVGHSLGGLVSLLTLLMDNLHKPASGLILVNSVAYFLHVPDFIQALRTPLANVLALGLPTQRVLVRQVLGEIFYDPKKITEELISVYTGNLSSPEAQKSLAASAAQFVSKDLKSVSGKFNQIRIPALILSGADDRVIAIEESYALKRDLPQSELKTIPMCGHSPQEECPEETAALVSEFLKKANFLSSSKGLSDRDEQNKRGGLFGRWGSAVSRSFSFARILEGLRKLKLLPEEDGWRKVTQAHLRREHSKFVLAAFRLDFFSDASVQNDRNVFLAQEHIQKRLCLFFERHPLVYGHLEWGKFSTRAKKKDSQDIVCADFNEDGTLKRIQPRFDQSGGPFECIREEGARQLDELMVDVYNQSLSVNDDRRPRRLKKELKKRVLAREGRSKQETRESRSYLKRISNSIFIHFEVLPPEEKRLALNRFKCPDFLRRKHPGLGTMNIYCRLTADLAEADLWFQISHVAMDGVPTQNMLNALKAEWKICGDLVFPVVADRLAEAAPVQCTTENGESSLYYADQLIDFRPLLKAREALNTLYEGQLPSPIPVISMLGWGLAQQPVFSGKKFLFPVDLPSTRPGERTLGFVNIRPARYMNDPSCPDAFLAYQQAFHRKLLRARSRTNGIYKLFELSALLPPVVYWFVQKFLRRLYAIATGSVVITMIKDADFFVAPYSDMMLDGFIAFGKYSTPTEDKKVVGLVSAKSTRDKVTQYLKAVELVVADFDPMGRPPQAAV